MTCYRTFPPIGPSRRPKRLYYFLYRIYDDLWGHSFPGHLLARDGVVGPPQTRRQPHQRRHPCRCQRGSSGAATKTMPPIRRTKRSALRTYESGRTPHANARRPSVGERFPLNDTGCSSRTGADGERRDHAVHTVCEVHREFHSARTTRRLVPGTVSPCPTCCWPWQGRCDEAGYGRATYLFADGHREYFARRIAWTLCWQRPVPDDKESCHPCDHLGLGKHAEAAYLL
jgi:prepilin-type processing-associated H-X9-DG protein